MTKNHQPMNKRNQTKARTTTLQTREAMESTVGDYARLKLRHVSVLAQIAEARAEVEQRYRDELLELTRELEEKFAAVKDYCERHRAVLLPGDRKSFETLAASIRFYDTPPRVEKRGRETLGAIARRLLGLVFDSPNAESGQPAEVLECRKYVREPEPELNKEALLADRRKFTEAQLQAMGLRFRQDEVFAIEPKCGLSEADLTQIETRLAA